MKPAVRKPMIVLAWILGALLILSFIKDQIIKTAVTIAAKEVTGADVTIDHFSLAILKQSVKIKGFKMYNPPGFPNEVMVDIPEVVVACDVPALLKGSVHLPYLRLHLRELVVVKDREGRLNINSLKFTQKKDQKETSETKTVKLQLDLVSLNIGDVVMKDLSAPSGKVSVQVYNVHVKDRQYKNVSDAAQLSSLVLLEALKPTAIQGATVYGAAALLGVAVLPVGVAAIVVGNDESRTEFTQSEDEVYKTCLSVLKGMGRVIAQDRSKRLIMAEVQGASVRASIGRSGERTKLTVKARKFMMPRAHIAAGVVREIRTVLE